MRVALAAAAVVAVVSGGVALFVAGGARAHRRTAPSDGSDTFASIATPSADASRPRTAVTELPLPSSANPEALAAYRAAMQAFRDGASSAWHANLARAAALDPSLAAAHLRLGWILASGAPSSAREHFTKATLLRSMLSPHDEALLDAGVPYFQGERADLAACERGLEAAAARFPGDAELLFFLGAAHADRGDFAAAERTHARAIDVDPKFAMALGFRGIYQAYLDDIDGAYRSFAQCLEAAPGATLCLHFRSNLDELEGNCARIESDARHMIAIDPRGPTGYAFLAEAMYGLGQGRDVTRETLRQEAERVPSAARRDAELTRELHLAELGGDFAIAERNARDLETAAAASASGDEGKHASAAAALVEILTETGRAAEAGQTARAFLVKRAAWMLNPRGEDYAVAADVTPMMLTAEARAGLISDAELEDKRAEWLRRWKSELAPAYWFTLWAHGVAEVVESPKDAAHALELLDVYGPPRRFGPLVLARAALGRAELRAGKVDAAIASLEIATHACVALAKPVEHTRAHALLGEALAANGDKGGACAAYRVVLDRWGKATPRSVTADATKKRARALGCAL